MAIFVIVGMIAFVVDISWYWASGLRAQRAADAAALAGVVYLPGNVAQAITTAKAAAAANGFSDGVGGVVVVPSQDNSDDRRMNVTINAPVGTFFARVFGINCWQSQQEGEGRIRPRGADGQPAELLRRRRPSPRGRCVDPRARRIGFRDACLAGRVGCRHHQGRGPRQRRRVFADLGQRSRRGQRRLRRRRLSLRDRDPAG